MITPWLFDIFNYPWSTDARKFDTEGCQDLYDWHFDSWVLAEEAGFEGIFFSEHHYTPYSVSPRRTCSSPPSPSAPAECGSV